MTKLPHSDPREMVETAFLASTTAMLFLINFYFPLGPLLRMLFPCLLYTSDAADE